MPMYLSDRRRQSRLRFDGIHVRHGYPVHADFEHRYNGNDAANRQGGLGIFISGKVKECKDYVDIIN